MQFVGQYANMFLQQSCSCFIPQFTHLFVLTITHFQMYEFSSVMHDHCNFTVPMAHHGPIVDVCRSNNRP